MSVCCYNKIYNSAYLANTSQKQQQRKEFWRILYLELQNNLGWKVHTFLRYTKSSRYSWQTEVVQACYSIVWRFWKNLTKTIEVKRVKACHVRKLPEWEQCRVHVWTAEHLNKQQRQHRAAFEALSGNRFSQRTDCYRRKIKTNSKDGVNPLNWPVIVRKGTCCR